MWQGLSSQQESIDGGEAVCLPAPDAVTPVEHVNAPGPYNQQYGSVPLGHGHQPCADWVKEPLAEVAHKSVVDRNGFWLCVACHASRLADVYPPKALVHQDLVV